MANGTIKTIIGMFLISKLNSFAHNQKLVIYWIGYYFHFIT